MVNTTGKWSFNSIAQTILIGFSTEFLYVKILALGRGVSSFFCHAKAKLPRNTGLLRFADGNYRQATVATIVPLRRFHRF